jgi:hypothetical protein
MARISRTPWALAIISLVKLLAANRRHCPLAKPVSVFDDVHGYLIVALESLLLTRPERFHFAFAILANRGVIDLKIEPPLVDDPEKGFILITPKPPNIRRASTSSNPCS